MDIWTNFTGKAASVTTDPDTSARKGKFLSFYRRILSELPDYKVPSDETLSRRIKDAKHVVGGLPATAVIALPIIGELARLTTDGETPSGLRLASLEELIASQAKEGS